MRLTCILILFLSITALPAFTQQTTTARMEVISGEEGDYHFEVPAGMFRAQGDFRALSNTRRVKVWTAPQQQAEISLFTTAAYMGDENEIFNMEDLAAFCRDGLQVTYKAGGVDWSVASGFDKQGRIVYRKGFFDELRSMRGSEQGEPSWVYSKSMILEFKYPPASASVMNRVVSAAIKSFRCMPDIL